MPRRASRSSSLALLVGLGAALAGSAAFAQPCCAGASILTPARLTLHEDALVGLQVRAGDVVGSFDASRNFLPASSGATEYDLEQDAVGTLRILEKAQATLTVPVVETYRGAPGTSEFGGGIGDVALSARYDFLLAGESTRWPGIALLAGLSFPTGRPIEQASLPLGSDATGTGAFQGTVGLAIEQSWRHLFLNATGLLTQSAPRHVQGVTEWLGLQGSVAGAVGWGFDSGPALAVVAAFVDSRDATLNGLALAGSGQAKTIAGLGGAMPINDNWRMQGTLTAQIPLSGFGRNEVSTVGLSFLLMRTWS